MKIGSVVELEDVRSGWSPVAGGVEYTDQSGARVFIPLKLLVRLHDGAKWHYEKNNRGSEITWDEYCDSLFKETD